MKNLLLFAVLIFPMLANAQSMDDKIKTLANEIADQVVKSGNKKVAVTTFDYKDCTTEFGKSLAEDLTGYLSVSGRSMTVVNQKLLERLLEQNRLTAKGLLEAKNDAAKLGLASGINALVYGTITTVNEEVRISVSIVKLPTLEVFGFSKNSFPLTKGIKDMLPCASKSGEVPPEIDVEKDNENAEKDADRKCASNHTGTYCFQNATKSDIKVQTTNAVFTIHPGQNECNFGMTAGDKGEYTHMLYIYRNPKESVFESRQIVVSECQKKTYVVR